jgi:hypothetical protein
MPFWLQQAFPNNNQYFNLARRKVNGRCLSVTIFLSLHLTMAASPVHISIGDSLAEATARQLMKDFSFFGFFIAPKTLHQDSYTWLFINLKPLCAALLRLSEQRRRGVLYAIDLEPEKLYRHHSSRNNWTPVESLADLLIRRAMEKVVWRMALSEKNPTGSP